MNEFYQPTIETTQAPEKLGLKRVMEFDLLGARVLDNHIREYTEKSREARQQRNHQIN